MTIAAIDTETLLFGPGVLAPRVVCLSVAAADGAYVIGNNEGSALEGTARELLEGRVIGHNIPYDLACLTSTFPSLGPYVWQALEEGRIHDTYIREKLILLHTTGDIDNEDGKMKSYSLAALAEARCGIALVGKDEEDAWRLRYAELDGVPASEYPQEAYSYAKWDAIATLQLFQEQSRYDCFTTEYLHVKAAFCYYLKAAWGLKVDKAEKERIQAEVQAQLSPEALPLLYSSGVMIPAQGPRPYAKAKDHVPGCRKKGCGCPPKMTKATPEKCAKKDKLVPLVEKVSQENGIELTLTKTGQTSTAGEVIEVLKGYDPVLAQYAVRAELKDLLTRYFPAMEWPYASGQTANIVHTKYDPLKKTGRCSARGNTKRSKNPAYPAVAVQQADPRVRGCYVPRDGHLFLSCDYDALELCSLAQTIYDLYGHSNLRDQINAGQDPHAFLGSVLAFEGHADFRRQATGLSDDEGYTLFKSKEKSDAEWYDYWRTYAKPVGLGFPGGLGAKTMVSFAAGYGVMIDQNRAKSLREIWFSVYPLMRDYLRRWVPAQQMDPTDKRSHVYVSPLGMRRVGCSYTECANGNALQTPAAEGMKEATFLVSRECYDYSLDSVLLGCKPVVNMHDELLIEVPAEDVDLRHARAKRVAELMVQGMETVIKDVRVSCEPALMERWNKKAKPVYDEEGRLEVWRPTKV